MPNLHIGCPKYGGSGACSSCYINIGDGKACAWEAKDCTKQLTENSQWLTENIKEEKGRREFVEYRMEELNCFEGVNGQKNYEEITGAHQLPWAGANIPMGKNGHKMVSDGRHTLESASDYCADADDCVYVDSFRLLLSLFLISPCEL